MKLFTVNEKTMLVIMMQMELGWDVEYYDKNRELVFKEYLFKHSKN